MTGASALPPRDLDALRELASIGSGQALTALARLLDRPVHMEVPEAWVGGVGALGAFLGALGGDLLAVGVRLEGLLDGHLLLALPDDDAARLALALGEPVVTSSLDASESPLAISALLESGNIVGSAFVSAVARIVGERLLLSVPQLARGGGAACLTELVPPRTCAVALATRFHVEAPGGIQGLLLVLPEPTALPALLASLRSA